MASGIVVQSMAMRRVLQKTLTTTRRPVGPGNAGSSKYHPAKPQAPNVTTGAHTKDEGPVREDPEIPMNVFVSGYTQLLADLGKQPGAPPAQLYADFLRWKNQTNKRMQDTIQQIKYKVKEEAVILAGAGVAAVYLVGQSFPIKDLIHAFLHYLYRDYIDKSYPKHYPTKSSRVEPR